MRRLDIVYGDRYRAIKKKLDTALENEVTIKQETELKNYFSGEFTKCLEQVIITKGHYIRLYSYYNDPGSEDYIYRYEIKKRP